MHYPTASLTAAGTAPTEDRAISLRRIYDQVLERQPYHHERLQLAKAELAFLAGKLGVRRFLKDLGQSAVYLEAFYFTSSNLKFIERCFKHFMGRAPVDQQEMRLCCDLLMKHGVSAFILSLLDSEEYRKAFGCFTVPHPRQLAHHLSPRAFWESHVLNQEQLGQRGEVVPTLVWHQLGLDCNAGTCRPREVVAVGPTAAAPQEVPAAAASRAGQMHRPLTPKSTPIARR
ncbi:MAG: phycobilisome rod-core linker polypeptide [Kaiparowitsia implicata GSE-PSE-MK54-09C]|jgi:hypothetical protein|nr:phycobilisome rod-core linker polypeptide [Kaiparowitsia implicata GSE-PSE-MK54-09C]